MWRVALRGITQRKRRFFSTMIAIVISVAFLTGVGALSSTIRGTFDSLFASVYGGTDAVVASKGTLDGGFRRAPKRLPRAMIDRLRTVDGVAAADGLVQGYAQVVDRDGVALGGTNAPTFGAAWQDDPQLNPFSIAEGRAPAAVGEVVIDRNTARLGELTLGEQVEILTIGTPVTATVVGFTRFGTADSPAGIAYTHFTAAQADQVFQTNGSVDQILVLAAPGVSQPQLVERITPVVQDGSLEIFTGDEATAKRQSEFKERLKGFTVFLTVFALVSMFVATFVIFNTFQIILSQRQREMALLRAVGAGSGQLLRSVIVESFVIGVVASLIGLAVGVGVAFGFKEFLSSIGLTLASGPLVVTGGTLRAGMIAGVVSTVLAALLPAWRASRIPPVAAMSETVLEHRRPSRVRLALGLVLMTAAAVLLVTGLRGEGNPAVYRVGASAGVTVIGLILLDPLLLTPFTRSLGSSARLRGVAGQLAQENVLRSPRRNALTAFPLLFGAALVGLLLVFVASFKAQIFETVEGQFKGDFFVTTKGGRGLGFSQEVAKVVRNVEGVEALTPVRFFFGDPKIVDGKGSSTSDAIVAVDTASVLQTVDIPVLSGAIPTMQRNDIAISSEAAARTGWKVGDALTLEVRDIKVPLRVAAVIDASKVIGLFQGAAALTGIDTIDAIDPFKLDQVVYVRTTDRSHSDIAGMKKRLTDAVAPYATVEIGDLASYKRLVDEQVAPILRFILGLLFISVLIATIGVANTMKLSVAERTREIGVLRAVGMHRRQARSMVRWEAIIIAVFGVIIGAGIGAGFGVAVMKTLRSQGFTQSVVPVGQFVLMALVAAALGILAATGAARRVGKLDVLRAISIE